MERLLTTTSISKQHLNKTLLLQGITPMPEREKKHQTLQKALEINLDNCKYGTIVEIGAGQEVARNFFRAGGAAGTVAKTMSAYDMQVRISMVLKNQVAM
jgi:hypothetical protein